jgi:[ribosomal protein S18]-alanine N-acetyltransferase
MSAVLKPRSSLRPMRPADLDQVVVVERSIYSHPWTLGNFRDSLQAGYSCWVMDGPDGLIGYGVLMIGIGEAHLLNLSIARPWQRCGLGRMLLGHFVELAGRFGATRMLLEVRPSNVAARALYTQAGFLELAVRRGYYPADSGREDAILMGIDIP